MIGVVSRLKSGLCLFLLVAVAGTALALFGAKPETSHALTAQQVYDDVIQYAPAATALSAAEACGNKGWNVFFETWVSAPGNPKQTFVEVNENDPSAPMQLNYLSYRCNTNSRMVSGDTQIVDTTPSIAALENHAYDVPFVSSNTTGLRTGRILGFDYPGPFNGFKTDTTVTIDVRARGTVTRQDPTEYVCALQLNEPGPPKNVSGPRDFGPCTIGSSRFTIEIRIRDNPPTVFLSADCNKLSYRVSDRDGDKYNIRLRWDGNDTNLTANGQSPSSTPGDVYTFDISNRKDYSLHIASVKVVSLGRAGHVVQDTPVTAITGAPCVRPTCQQINLNPGSPEAGMDFDLSTSINGSIGSAAPAVGYFVWVESGFSGVTISPGSAPRYAQAGTIPSGGNPSTTTWTMRQATPGYVVGSIKFTIGSSPNQEITCSITDKCTDPGGCIPVSTKPYVRVWRGDVLAGCQAVGAPWYSSSSAGKILGWSAGNPTNGRGAGTDFAAQALGAIDSFSSRQNAQTKVDTKDKVMTFANAGNGVGNWGGNFGAGLCASSRSFPATSGGTLNGPVDTTQATASYQGGTLTGGAIPEGKKITVYVNGDLDITGNVTYDNSGGTWANLASIPSLTVIVKGNIRIASNVSTLSGTYIALPKNSSNGGTIYTCTNGNNTVTELVAGCSNQLTVYGSFAAKTIKFLRLSGTTSTADAGNTYGVGTAAEKFIYSPELWLASSGTNSQAGMYDSITSLPPIF